MPEEKNNKKQEEVSKAKPEAKPEDLASLWGSGSKKEGLPATEKPEVPEQKTKEKPAEKPKHEPEQKKEEISVAPTEANATEILPEEASFGEKVDSMLEELNLTRRHVFIGCGCLVLLGIFIYAAVWFFSTKKTEEKPVVTTQQIPETSKMPVKQTGVYSSLIFGRPFLLPLSFFSGHDILLSILIGEGKAQKSQFAQYIFLLKRMQNAYATDVNALLNSATDRRGVLKNHVARLKALNEEGRLQSQRIKEESARYKTVFDELSAKQTELETGFFSQIKEFNPGADESLNEFIKTAKESVGIKARFRSLEQISKYFDQALPRLAARIKDIELNEEPLVAGIKIYDVKGSDLQLIIVEEGAAGKEQVRGFPFLGPEITGEGAGYDYVTKPPPLPTKK